MQNLKHRIIGNTALPYITNISPIDPTPRYVLISKNLLTSNRGYAERRPALDRLFSITQQGTGLIRRLFHWQRWNGDFFLMAAIVDVSGVTSKVLKYKVGTDSDWVVLTTASDTTTYEPYDFAVANNHLFMANGNKMLKYDGTTVTNWGITAPSTALTLTPSAGAGALTGAYQYVITFLNNTTGHQSSPSPVSSVTVAAKDITVTGNTTTDTQVTHVNLFRTAAGGSILFKHPASPITYATWTGSGYTDSTADTALSATIVAPVANQNNRPPSAKGLEAYQGRLWVFADDKVYYSGFEEIPLGTSDMPEECFPPDNYFPFGKALTGVAAIGDPAKDGVLGVFSPSTLFYVNGDSLSTFARGVIAHGVGTRNRASISKFRKLIAWFDSSNTVQICDGSTVREIGKPVRPDFASTVHSDVFTFIHSSGEDQWLCVGAYAQSTSILTYDLDMEQWMPPWVLSLAPKAGASVETAAGTFRPIVAVNGYPSELSRSINVDDDGGAFESGAVINRIDLTSKPDNHSSVHDLVVEYGTTGPETVSILPDGATFENLTSISGNPSDPPFRTQASTVIEKHYRTDVGAACRRVVVELGWPDSDTAFEFYGLDVAYREIES